MANKIKGEFEIVAGEATYKGRFGMNALVEIEEAFGKPVEEVFATLEHSKSIKAARSIFGAALRTYHPDLSDSDVGNIIDQVGMDRMSGLMAEGVKAAFPEADKGSQAGGAANPTSDARAGAGTGRS